MTRSLVPLLLLLLATACVVSEPSSSSAILRSEVTPTSTAASETVGNEFQRHRRAVGLLTTIEYLVRRPEPRAMAQRRDVVA